MDIIETKTGYINYGTLRAFHKKVNRDVNTLDEYIEWVREWKALNKAIVEAIKQYRAIKHDLMNGRVAYSGIIGPNDAQERKLALRPYARQMYELRAAQKERYKAGAFSAEVIAA